MSIFPARRRCPLYRIVPLLLVSLWSIFHATGQSRAEAPPDLVVVNVADTHSAYDAYPRMLSGMADIAGEYDGTEVVFLFNGDLFELGNAAARRSAGRADWEFLRRLRALGEVVINVGNHEFDFVTPAEFVATAREYDVTVIGTVGTVDNPELTPFATDLFVADRRVRIVGVGTDSLNTYPQPLRESLSIPDPVAWIESRWDEVTSGADLVILASHAGLTTDLAMLDAVAGDEALLFAVGGHDHIVVRQTVAGVPYLHNGFRGERFNVVEVYLSSSTRVHFRDMVTADIAREDAAMAREIASVRDTYLEPDDVEVVGTVSGDMTVLEGAMWAVETLKGFTDADVVFLNHTSFGSGLSRGPLPRYRFDQFMRFDNDVMRATVDAATLRTILARSNQHEMGDVALRSGDFLYANGVSIVDGRTYDVVTSSWVALDFNQMRYLGVEVAFETIPGVTTKGILLDALNE